MNLYELRSILELAQVISIIVNVVFFLTKTLIKQM